MNLNVLTCPLVNIITLYNIWWWPIFDFLLPGTHVQATPKQTLVSWNAALARDRKENRLHFCFKSRTASFRRTAICWVFLQRQQAKSWSAAVAAQAAGPHIIRDTTLDNRVGHPSLTPTTLFLWDSKITKIYMRLLKAPVKSATQLKNWFLFFPWADYAQFRQNASLR